MGREIRFRAWDKETRMMIDRLESCRGMEACYQCFGHFLNPDRYELMQFTGLLDRHGKEIWEGDVVRVQSQYETDEPIDSAPNNVYFRDGAFRCGFHDMILGEKVCTGSEGNWNMEVLGNIHENPEMLK